AGHRPPQRRLVVRLTNQVQVVALHRIVREPKRSPLTPPLTPLRPLERPTHAAQRAPATQVVHALGDPQRDVHRVLPAVLRARAVRHPRSRKRRPPSPPPRATMTIQPQRELWL